MSPRAGEWLWAYPASGGWFTYQSGSGIRFEFPAEWLAVDMDPRYAERSLDVLTGIGPADLLEQMRAQVPERLARNRSERIWFAYAGPDRNRQSITNTLSISELPTGKSIEQHVAEARAVLQPAARATLSETTDLVTSAYRTKMFEHDLSSSVRVLNAFTGTGDRVLRLVLYVTKGEREQRAGTAFVESLVRLRIGPTLP